MRSEKNKIKLIVDELLSNSVEANAKDIDIHVERTDKEIIITVKDDGVGMAQEDLEYARSVLNQPYSKDIEEYYGQLAGMESSQGGLNLVGMQVRHAEIDSTEGEGTTITVRRLRNPT